MDLRLIFLRAINATLLPPELIRLLKLIAQPRRAQVLPQIRQPLLERQQRALHAAVVTRDTQIHELRQALAQRVAAEPISAASGATEETAALRQLVSERDRRLASETRRRATLEARLEAAQDTTVRERMARLQAERISQALREELDAIEASLVATCIAQPCGNSSEPLLNFNSPSQCNSVKPVCPP